MKIEEAILYLLAKKNGGMTTDQLADEINRNRLVVLNGDIFDDIGPLSKPVYLLVYLCSKYNHLL